MSFQKRRSPSDSLCLIRQLALECAKRGGPLSKQLNQLLEKDDFLGLIDFKFDYSQEFTRDDFIYARQIQALVSKQDFLDLGIDKEKVALDLFVKAEEKCRETNIRLSDPSSANADVSAIYHYAIRKIERILGDVPSLDALDFSFGPGATTNVKRTRSHPRVKLEVQLMCSTNMVPYLSEYLNEIPLWADYHTKDEKLSVEVDVGKLVFVPKTSKTLRSICVEPILNGFFQKGVGTYLKKRLKRAGVDLSDQTRNRDLAKKGSESGSLATIDLASASDTVSRELVWQLLPFEWVSLLDSMRTGTVRLPDGKEIDLEKFSSMGNSYTFELESLIFYGLTWATCYHLGIDTEDVSVFGDDIIVPTQAVTLLKDVLEYSGFEVNSSKSFMSGPFRESCGADYLRGFDIRPFYLKESVSVRYLFVMHNWFYRNFEFALANIVKAMIPNSFILTGPDGYGDGHLIGDFHLQPLSRKKKRAGYEGGSFETWVATPRRLKWLLREHDHTSYPTYCVYALSSEEEREHDVIPGYDVFSKVSIYTSLGRIFQEKRG